MSYKTNIQWTLDSKYVVSDTRPACTAELEASLKQILSYTVWGRIRRSLGRRVRKFPRKSFDKIFTEIILNYLPELVTYAHVLTMKISQKIDQSTKDGKVWWSFEYFPPRTAQVGQWRQDASMFSLPSLQGLQNLLDRIERMRALGPEFIDITWWIHLSFLLAPE